MRDQMKIAAMFQAASFCASSAGGALFCTAIGAMWLALAMWLDHKEKAASNG